MKDYIRNVTLAASLFLSSSALALEVNLEQKTQTRWTMEQENTWIIRGFGVEEHKYTVQVFDTDVRRATQNSALFLEEITAKIYALERNNKPDIEFTPEAIRKALHQQHPEFRNSKLLQPGNYDINLKQIYGYGLMATT